MRAATWVKMIIGGGAICVGGPALVYYVTPTEEELFKKYNPELQRRSLERRQEKQEDFENFVSRLKEYSKSDEPIWTAWEKDVERRRKLGVQQELDRRKVEAANATARREEMAKSLR